MCRESKWVGNTLQAKKEVKGVEYYVVGGETPMSDKHREEGVTYTRYM